LKRDGAKLGVVLYAAKCYWPGITERELDRIADRISQRTATEFVGLLFFPQDDVVLCLFNASSRSAVTRASQRAGIPCERVMESVWLTSQPRRGTTSGGPVEADHVIRPSEGGTR
jgi:hypothetical protein